MSVDFIAGWVWALCDSALCLLVLLAVPYSEHFGRLNAFGLFGVLVASLVNLDIVFCMRILTGLFERSVIGRFAVEFLLGLELLAIREV